MAPGSWPSSTVSSPTSPSFNTSRYTIAALAHSTSTIACLTASAGSSWNQCSTGNKASEEHFCKTHYKVKHLGSGDNGDTYAAISKADANAISRRHSCKNTPAYYDELRAKLLAVKFYKDDNLEGDLENEIMFLSQSLPCAHERMTPAKGSHLDGKSQWLALPFCSGGDLQSFLEKFPQAASSVSFQWHVAYQLAESLLFLLYGVKNVDIMESTPDWPSLSHCDIFAGNILLKPAPADSKTGFPDIIIADFGRAAELDSHLQYDPGNDNEEWRNNFEDRQCEDIRSIARVLGHLQDAEVYAKLTCDHCIDYPCPNCKNDKCTTCIKAHGERSRLGPGTWLLAEWKASLADFGKAETIGDGFSWLRSLMETAKENCRTHWEPMPAEALAALKAEKVSNKELDLALRRTKPLRKRNAKKLNTKQLTVQVPSSGLSTADPALLGEVMKGIEQSMALVSVV